MLQISDFAPLLVFVALLVFLPLGLRSLLRDRHRGAASAGIQAFQEIFEPGTRPAREARARLEERAEDEDGSPPGPTDPPCP